MTHDSVMTDIHRISRIKVGRGQISIDIEYLCNPMKASLGDKHPELPAVRASPGPRH